MAMGACGTVFTTTIEPAVPTTAPITPKSATRRSESVLEDRGPELAIEARGASAT
ncbi:hypothetical protein GCM10009755_21900 [Brevibacterium samyangense]|uniref:Uncharacterized protein n=1 Tax=Brevibacterium samyangense TaxID=366888 RepID=A0ABP5EY78_9MICO